MKKYVEPVVEIDLFRTSVLCTSGDDLIPPSLDDDQGAVMTGVEI